MKKQERYIYSDNNECMIHAGFTFIIHPGYDMKEHFSWNEADELYYNDDDEEDYYSLDSAVRKVAKWQIEGVGYWD